MSEYTQELFSSAYGAYQAIMEQITEENNDDSSATEASPLAIMCSFDLYLQSFLVRLAAIDGEVIEEERTFICDIADHSDELYRLKKGYRRFLRQLSADNIRENASEMYSSTDFHPFFDFLHSCNPIDAASIVNNLEKIANLFIAIDNDILPKESSAVIEEIASIRQRLHIPENISASEEGEEAHEKTTEELLAELHSLVGLDQVKAEVDRNIKLLQVNAIRKAKGLPETPISKHLVFTGPPGTGKTTVARILAQLYKQIGIVSAGQLIETDRSGLVAGYVGQTAIKAMKVIKKAKGGILFIDEAYSLTESDSSNDYGKEAIDTLVKAMEDYREDMVVIVAGYENEMHRFIEANPGLRSRFSRTIHFASYTDTELLEIFNTFCTKNKYVLDDFARAKAYGYFKEHYTDDTFGNARGVRNYFEMVITNQATRLINTGEELTTEMLSMILPEDME